MWSLCSELGQLACFLGLSDARVKPSRPIFFSSSSFDFMSLSGRCLLTASGLWIQVEKSLPEFPRCFLEIVCVCLCVY